MPFLPKALPLRSRSVAITKHYFSSFLPGLFGRKSVARAAPARAEDAKRARFDAEIQKGVEAAAEGKVKDADEVFDRLEAKYEAMSKRRG